MARRSFAKPLLFTSLLVALAITPWFANPLSPESRKVFVYILGANAILFALIAVAGRFRRMPRVALICWALLLLQGWAMTINAQGIYKLSSRGQPGIEPIAGWSSSLPGALDGDASRQAMQQVTGLAAVFGSACLLGTSLRWRRRVVIAILAMIVCVVAQGFLERAGVLNFYETSWVPNEGLPFASFNYHANAGAFLNLGLGLACGCAAIARRGARRNCFLIAAAVSLAGVIATGSRGSAIVSVAIMCVALSCRVFANRSQRRVVGLPSRRRFSKVVTGVVAALLVAALAGTVYELSGKALARWADFHERLTRRNPRVVLWKLTLPRALHAGPFGSGPGGFKIVMSMMDGQLSPLYPIWIVRPYNPARATSMWLQMHNDPLQTLLEWGWLGAGLWTILIAGAFVANRRRDRTWFAIRLAIAGCLLHGCFDFPLQVPAIQVYIAALLGLAWATRPSPRKLKA